ncbi:MAG: DUF1295 domain-containing protein [Candidatus Dojkabacteria bacterium]|nr:DUF1295 domain-containing protein [Candidatus Dojkabacteria bacterium]
MDFELSTMEILLISLGTSVGIQVVFSIAAVLLRTDLFTDLSYGMTFVIGSWLNLVLTENLTAITVLLTILITIWGIRLAGYLFIRIIVTGRDRRFDGIRENPVKFLIFWLFQGVSVWVILLPAQVVFLSNPSNSIPLISWIGAFVAFLGISIETVADQQKFTFKRKKPERWIDTGLWKFSRHPNYFGELLMWWGIFVLALPYHSGFAHLSILEPIWITILLLLITDIPTLEKRYDDKYGTDKAYQMYKDSTPLLIPSPK